MTNNLKAERTLTAEELQAIIDGCEGVTPGPWSYRPDYLDDWGAVRASKDTEGRAWFIASVKAGRHVPGEEIQHHRVYNTDPYGANAKHISRLDPETVRSMALELQSLRSQSLSTQQPMEEPDQDSIRIMRQFADQYRPGAAGSEMDCDSAMALALAMDDVLSALHPNQESGE